MLNCYFWLGPRVKTQECGDFFFFKINESVNQGHWCLNKIMCTAQDTLISLFFSNSRVSKVRLKCKKFGLHISDQALWSKTLISFI